MVLCIAAAPVVCGQSPGKKTLPRPPFDDTKIINTATSFPVATVPQLYGMNRTEAGRFLESLRLRAIFSGVENGVVVAQKPPAETSVRTGSGVAVILGVLPRVVLTGPAAPAYAGSDLTFTATLAPPIPEGIQVTYNFQWNDGTPSSPTKSAVVTHKFADAARRVVGVIVTINDRVKVAGRIPVDVVAVPPPTDTTPSDTTPSDTSATTTTVAPTETQPTETTQTTIPPTETAPPATTTAPTTTTAQATTVPETPPGAPAQTALLLIGVVAIILLLTVVVLLVRVLRKMNRTPSAQTASPLSIKGGPGSVEFEIEHPEQIRKMPAVQVRGGIRADEGDDDA